MFDQLSPYYFLSIQLNVFFIALLIYRFFSWQRYQKSIADFLEEYVKKHHRYSFDQSFYRNLLIAGFDQNLEHYEKFFDQLEKTLESIAQESQSSQHSPPLPDLDEAVKANDALLTDLNKPAFEKDSQKNSDLEEKNSDNNTAQEKESVAIVSDIRDNESSQRNDDEQAVILPSEENDSSKDNDDFLLDIDLGDDDKHKK